jgi:hypothetical protein
MGGYRRHFLIFAHLYPEITRSQGGPPGRAAVGVPLPGLVLLKSQDEDHTAEQPGKGDKLLAFYCQNAIHEKYLTDDQKKGKDNKDNPAHEFF